VRDAPESPAREPGRPDAAERDRAGLRAAPPVPVSAPRAPFVALVLVVVIAGVLGILVLNTKINENAFQLTNLEAQQVALDQQEQQLSEQLADRESPNNLAAEALKLGRDISEIQVRIIAAAGTDQLICVGIAAFHPAVNDTDRAPPHERRPAVPRLPGQREPQEDLSANTQPGITGIGRGR